MTIQAHIIGRHKGMIMRTARHRVRFHMAGHTLVGQVEGVIRRIARRGRVARVGTGETNPAIGKFANRAQ